jgi:hypothetical protein
MTSFNIVYIVIISFQAFADALGLSSKSLMQTVKSAASSALVDPSPSSHESEGAIEQHVLDSLAHVPLFFDLFRPDNPHGLVHVPKEIAFSNTVKINHLLQVLRKPLYSTELIAWAKNHRMDLMKVEKKIQELLLGLCLAPSLMSPRCFAIISDVKCLKMLYYIIFVWAVYR